MQPQELPLSKRFKKDNLNISDIPGTQSDVYKHNRNIEGRDQLEVADIAGAQPSKYK